MSLWLLWACHITLALLNRFAEHSKVVAFLSICMSVESSVQMTRYYHVASCCCCCIYLTNFSCSCHFCVCNLALIVICVLLLVFRAILASHTLPPFIRFHQFFICTAFGCIWRAMSILEAWAHHHFAAGWSSILFATNVSGESMARATCNNKNCRIVVIVNCH